MEIQSIPYQNPSSVFTQFAEQPGALFLDSAVTHDTLGRYSYIAVDPFAIIKCHHGVVTYNDQIITDNFFTFLQKLLHQYSLGKIKGLPPFQGGMAGFFSYDLCVQLERILLPSNNDVDIPEAVLCLYDLVAAYDHVLQQAWLFSSGYPHQIEYERKQHAKKRAGWILEYLMKEAPLYNFSQLISTKNEIISNFTQTEYEHAVCKVRDYILAGDIFEANISQRFSAALPETLSSFKLYSRLRALNKAPFCSYFNANNITIASSSPERFLLLKDNFVQTRPIKGTRKRGRTPAEDQAFAKQLITSEKDRAENIMIVDLMRNDLSRVCEKNSINVSALCVLESHATVHHLVSAIEGQLEARFNAVDLLQATFPGGSVTGAPKIRAMEIISNIEPNRRGPYCGAMGYLSFNGDMDTAIIIRTFVIKNNRITFHAGGAVTADSCPREEYEESLAKARALKEALI